jgi:UDP-2,3-diacylglucosamine pyrophosphatase LpxH
VWIALGDGPVIVVSDTHFGFEPESKARFENFLHWLITSDRKILTFNGEKTLEAPLKIILLGDILEYWAPRNGDASLAFKESFDSFNSLLAFAPETVYVSGNHDHVMGSYEKDYPPLENGSRILVRSDHYPDNLSEKPGKKYRGEQIGGKTYFFLHGHQFDFFRFPAVLKLGDFMARNFAMSRNFKWFPRLGAALLATSVFFALFTNWLPLLFIWVASLLQSASLLSFPITVALLLWGFFVFLGVLWVFGALTFLYYEYTHHSGQIRYRKKSTQQTNVQQLIDKRYYKREKDTIDADVIVFGHTHVPEISRAEDNGTNKSFVNSGSWIEYQDRQFDTFIYIDRDGSVLLQWDNVEKSVRELGAL